MTPQEIGLAYLCCPCNRYLAGLEVRLNWAERFVSGELLCGVSESDRLPSIKVGGYAASPNVDSSREVFR